MFEARKLHSGLWVVGFYHPDGVWQTYSEWTGKQKALANAAWLNKLFPETLESSNSAARQPRTQTVTKPGE